MNKEEQNLIKKLLKGQLLSKLVNFFFSRDELRKEVHTSVADNAYDDRKNRPDLFLFFRALPCWSKDTSLTSRRSRLKEMLKKSVIVELKTNAGDLLSERTPGQLRKYRGSSNMLFLGVPDPIIEIAACEIMKWDEMAPHVGLIDISKGDIVIMPTQNIKPDWSRINALIAHEEDRKVTDPNNELYKDRVFRPDEFCDKFVSWCGVSVNPNYIKRIENYKKALPIGTQHL